MGTLVELPNGLKLHAPNAMEAKVVYHEIFATEAYGKHGIAVKDGDCVFDVGANVGFFSVFLAGRHAGLRIVACEPIPAIFELLEMNTAAHLANVDARLVPSGLGASAGELTFRYDPGMTFNASAAVATLEKSTVRNASPLAWARAIVEDAGRSKQLSTGLTRATLALLRIPVVNVVTLAAMALVAAPFIVHGRMRTREVRCRIQRLSDVMRAQGIEAIDLLKIDVEGGEWDVLMGIDDGDWPRIRQMAIEVHDADNRVSRMATLLRDKGFDVRVDREDWSVHQLLGIHTVYARRV